MKIAASSLDLSSQHFAASSQSVSETLHIAIEMPPREGDRPSVRPEVRISTAARDAQAADATSQDDDGTNGDPFLKMVKSVVEMLIGHKLKVFTAHDLQPGGGSGAATPPPASPGLRMDYHREVSHVEFEQTAFQASGTIRTADGKDISFTLDMQMSRFHAETSSTDIHLDTAPKKDPLVINFAGTAAQLQDARFSFDLEGDGQNESLPMLASGSAFLALDRDGNGEVDSGQELFGATSGDGFADLAKLDSDGNGWLDDNDPAFAELAAWIPDSDGSGHLAKLKNLGVGALSLASQNTPFELKNAANQSLGTVRSTGVYLNEDGSAGTLQQVDLVV